MNSIKIAELQLKAFDLIDRKKVPENELKHFIALIMELLTKQYFEGKANKELLEEVINNISLKQIANER